MKRYYLIEKAKDADIIGILVGTLSVGSLHLQCEPDHFAQLIIFLNSSSLP